MYCVFALYKYNISYSFFVFCYLVITDTRFGVWAKKLSI